MTMNYKDALVAWGRTKLIEEATRDAEVTLALSGAHRFFDPRPISERNRATRDMVRSPEFKAKVAEINSADVTVSTEFGRGDSCHCGPYAESAYAEIVVNGGGFRATVEFEDFDLTRFIGEVVAAAGGKIIS